MNTILIGTNTLEVISAGAKRLPSGKVIVVVEAKQEHISHDDLRAMFKDTTDDLVINRDNGTKETYGGCHYAIKVHDDVKTMMVDGVEAEVEIHRAEIECSSEADFQLGRIRGAVDTHGTQLKSQADTINQHGTAINNQAKAILEHGDTLAKQEADMDNLVTSSALQTATIESMLLETIPFIIEMSVQTAVANALAGSNTTEEPVVEE